MSKCTHVRPDSVPTDAATIDQFASLTIKSFDEVFAAIKNARAKMEEAIEPHLYDEAISTFINETMQELDILVGRYETAHKGSKMQQTRPREKTTQQDPFSALQAQEFLRA